MKWTAEQEVEAIKQQLPDGAWKRGASLARCVEDLRMERDELKRQLDELRRVPKALAEFCEKTGASPWT